MYKHMQQFKVQHENTIKKFRSEGRVESLPSHEGYTDFRRLTFFMSSLKVVIILITLSNLSLTC